MNKPLTLPSKTLLPEQKLIALYQGAMQSCTAQTSCPVLHIASARRNEGSARIALEMAMTAAAKSGKNVLLIDASAELPAPLNGFSFAPAEPDQQNNQPVICKTTIERLSVSRLYGEKGDLLPAENIRAFLESCREHYDVILLHAEDMLSHENTFNAAAYADGAIMIIEAEKTRSPVALELKSRLEQSGAKIIGSVLNRRKFHIPGLVHKLLFRS